MKTLFKRPFAVFLAVLIAFSSLSAVISAADYPTGTFTCNSVWSVLPKDATDTDANYEVSNTCEPGQKVKVDFYVTTDYTTKSFAFLFGYNKNMLELDTSKSASLASGFYSNISSAGFGGKYKDGTATQAGLVTNGVKTEDYWNDVATVLEQATLSPAILLNTKALTFYFTVKEDVTKVEETDFAPVPGTIKNVKLSNSDDLIGNSTYIDEDDEAWPASDFDFIVKSTSNTLKLAEGTVKYDAGDGSLTETTSIKKDVSGDLYTGTGVAGKSVETPTPTAPANKTFVGWNTDANATEALSATALEEVVYKAENPDTLYAIYTDTPAKYNMLVKTMKADGTTYEEETTSDIPSTAGTEIAASSYTYDTTKYTLNTTDSVDITVSADETKTLVVVLDRKSFDITWKVKGNQVGDKVSKVWGADLTSVTNPNYEVPAGYTFEWSTLTNPMPAADQEVTGTLTPKPVIITLDAGDGTITPTTVNSEYDKTEALADPTPATEKTFAGWEYTDSSNAKQTFTGSTPALNLDNIKLTETADGYAVTFTAKYSTNVYNIVIVNTYTGEDEVVAVLTGEYGSATGKTLADYPYSSTTEKTFLGWDATEIPTTFGSYTGTYSTYTKCLVIKNQWKSNEKVTVKYDYKGETGYENKTMKDYPGQSLAAPELPSKSGYTYSWYQNLTAFPDNDVTVYLVKEALTTKVTFDPDNGDTPTENNVPYDTSVPKPADPVSTGKTFIKWVDESDNEFDFTKTLEDLGPYVESINLKAVYGYTDTYYVPAMDGNTLTYAKKLVVNDVTGKNYASDIPTVSMDGFEFLGWFDGPNDDANAVTPDGVIGTSSRDFYAHVKPHEHTVKYVNYDDTEIETFNTNFGATSIPTTSTVPTKPDDGATKYIFAGWKDADGKAPADYETMPDKDLVFKAQFEEKTEKHTVTYNVDGKTYRVFTDVEVGATVPTPDSDPKKFGKKFAGWTPEVPATMPDEDLVFEAKWEDKDTVAPVVIGGVVVAGAVIGTIAAVNTAVITGAAIVGGVVAITGAVHVAKHTYKVTYVVNGETYRVFYVIEGTKIPVPKDPSVDGAKFAGWSPEVPSKMPAKDLTFKAVFVDGSIPDTGSASTAFATLAIVSSATLAAYVIRKKKDEEDF